MEYNDILDQVEREMFDFNAGDPRRIHHLMKVHDFARLIGRMEGLDAHTQFVTECAALVHDIGIRPAERKYGACHGALQEQEGPACARSLLEKLGLDAHDVERICYLVGHHHTYRNIEGMDYQILVEADFLVNFYEDEMDQAVIARTMERIFRTQSGRTLCRTIYGVKAGEEA